MSYLIKPVLDDINNDGIGEAILGNMSHGILILDMSLDSLTFIADTNLYDMNSEIVTGDFNNDGSDDIVTQTRIHNYLSNFDYFLKIYDFSGIELYKTPIFSDENSFWVSDIDMDGENDIVLSTKLSANHERLFVVKVPDAGSSIGWPGQQGNFRNTGVLEQPAYFAPAGDTVYWMNTISLAGDNIIPAGSTVIIKPGTRIKAHSGASLVVDGILIAKSTENHPIAFTADINGADKGHWQGITVSNHGLASFEYCKIAYAAIGVLAEDNSNVTIIKCTIKNNLEGIGAFNSEPYIEQNFITTNDIGISSYKNGSPVLSDLKNEMPFRNGILDNSTGIQINNANIYLDYGYNDIYNSPQSGLYIQLLSEFPFSEVYARNNYWGGTDIEQINKSLEPAEAFIIEPVLTSPQSQYSPGGSSKSEMLSNAVTDKDNGDYESAELTFKAIVQQYPQTQEAYISVSGIYECYAKSNGNMQNLENYYTALYNDSTYSQDFVKLVFGYINLCKREQGKFDEAVANYESIILNDPSYNDSVYAVIDIGNTYEEAGNYKSTLGQLSYLVPASRAKHVEKTVDLLLSLKQERKTDNNHAGTDFRINAIYPNPFSGIVTVKYDVSSGCSISFETYDAIGRLVQSNEVSVDEKGEYSTKLNFDKVKPGVYYLVMKVGVEGYAVKKLIIK